jgi:uncharacterized protein (TIGR03083 family)
MQDLIPRSQAMDLFHRASGHVDHLLSTIDVPPETPVPHLDWTIGDLAAHLVQAEQIAGQLLDGETSPYQSFDVIAELNARFLAEKPERDLPTLSRQFHDAIEHVSAKLQSLPDDARVPFHGGWTFSPPEAMAMMSGELLVHGWDLATTVGRPYEIDPADARLIIYAIAGLMPEIVDPESAKGFSGIYELRIRDGACFRLCFEDGELHVSRVTPGGPADCRILADAAAFLLMGYGRGSQIAPILTGKVVAWGLKPWLAAKFTSLVRSP